jgi:opacity protein-like surface antigen
MFKKLTLSVACIFALASSAQAAESSQTNDATVCTTAPYPALSAATAMYNDKIEFTCGNKQRRTIPSLVKAGWHIVVLRSESESSAVNPNPTSVTILVLEKTAK